jgi:hypothetical protein
MPDNFLPEQDQRSRRLEMKRLNSVHVAAQPLASYHDMVTRVAVTQVKGQERCL